MASRDEIRTKILKYLKNYQTFDAKSFDTNFDLIKNYGIEYGFIETDLILITDVAFKQKLAEYRLRKVINSLIPITRVPEKAVRNVLKWLLNNLHHKTTITLKIILRWLAGLVEYKLTTIGVIDSYYDIYYKFLAISTLESSACKLIYLLTKPADVSRWYAKQVLDIHLRNGKPKHTGAVLYLFKSYRPDCVPENIPAYSVYNVFGKILGYDLQIGFARAREHLTQADAIPDTVDVWKSLGSANCNVKKSTVILIPRLSVIEINSNIYLDGYKSAVSMKNIEDLYKYHVSSSSPNRALSLLNNSAGCNILTFADKTIQSRFSYQLYYTLNDGNYYRYAMMKGNFEIMVVLAFINRNPHIAESEKDRLLEKLSFCQIHMQQYIPVVSRFLAEFIQRWDGYEHQQHIYRLLQWLNVVSYKELQDCILDYLYDLFIASSVQTKCDILRILGELAINIITTHICRTTKDEPFLFLDVKVDWDFNDLIKNLLKYIENVCELGLILENNHNLLIYCIVNLHEKLFLAESTLDTKYWSLSTRLTYTAFFSYNPTNLQVICRLLHSFPQYVPETLRNDFIDCLWQKNAFLSDDPKSIFQDFNVRSKFFETNLPNCNELFSLQNHFGLACYNYNLIMDQTIDDLEVFMKNALSNYGDICLLLAHFS